MKILLSAAVIAFIICLPALQSADAQVPGPSWRDRAMRMLGSDELDSARARSVREGPRGYIRRFVETKTIGTYIVLLPPDYDSTIRSYPACLILHGSGSTELAHGRLADAIGREGVIYVVPRALYPHGSVFTSTGELGYTAWPADDIDSTDALYARPAPMYAEWIMQCLDDARLAAAQPLTRE